MAEINKPLSEEYWRPPAGNPFQRHGLPARRMEASCAHCGTPYALGAFFCHRCGIGHESDPEAKEQNAVSDWLDFAFMRTHFGLSAVSLVCVLAGVIFGLAAVMTGLVYDTSTFPQWQAVQYWRIEWLLAAVVALMAAMLFRTKP